MNEASKKGKFSRDKGARGEREIRDLFRAGGFKARRSIGQNRCGSDAPDVFLEGLPHIWVEVKRGVRCNIKAAYEQARFQCGKMDTPIAVTKEDHKDPLVTMSFDAYVDLLRRAYPDATMKEEERDAEEE